MSRLSGSTIREKLLLNHRKEGGCWRWTGAHISTGYGQISVNGKARGVHRAAYETFVGPIPEGLDIDHACNVRDCINPAHLRPMTHQENLLRSSSPPGRNAKKTHCPAGHPYDGPNLYIAPNGRRGCRACKRSAMAHYRRRALGGGDE